VTTQPVEPVGAEQDEVNHECQYEQECKERNQGSARIE